MDNDWFWCYLADKLQGGGVLNLHCTLLHVFVRAMHKIWPMNEINIPFWVAAFGPVSQLLHHADTAASAFSIMYSLYLVQWISQPRHLLYYRIRGNDRKWKYVNSEQQMICELHTIDKKPSIVWCLYNNIMLTCWRIVAPSSDYIFCVPNIFYSPANLTLSFSIEVGFFYL